MKGTRMAALPLSSVKTRASYRSAVGAVIAALVFVGADAASAATVAREGDAVVFRSAPGERAQVGGGADADADVIAVSTSQFPDSPVVPGAGCAFAPERPPRVGVNPYMVLCPLAGVRLFHIITADRDDIIDACACGGVPALVEAGGGSDKIEAFAESSNMAVLAGAGNDKLQAREGAGDLRVDGEAGDDELLTVPVLPQPGGIVLSGGPGDDYIYSHNDATLSGGDGDDRLTHSVNDPRNRGPAEITCGAGADIHELAPGDSVGAGCAPFLSRKGVKLRYSAARKQITVSGGRMSGPASVKFILNRVTRGRAAGVIANQRVRVPAGSLRATLKVRTAAVAALRREPNPEVGTTWETRTTGSADRGRGSFLVKLR